MKKLICIMLALIIAASALVCGASAATAKGTLTVTDGGVTIAEVEVGNEFIYRVGVNAGDNRIYSAQGYVKYDPNYVKVVEYGTVDKKGNVDMGSYCFPESVQNTSLVFNPLGLENYVKYNFTKPTVGIEPFDDVNKHYFKIRFKAVAAGIVEIGHVMEILSTRNESGTVRLFTGGVANNKISPIPYQQTTAEPATALIGDADGDYEVTVMDASFLQRAAAGVKSTYKVANADVNADGDVNLKDALSIRRYKAGMSTNDKVGEWIFESEQ